MGGWVVELELLGFGWSGWVVELGWIGWVGGKTYLGALAAAHFLACEVYVVGLAWENGVDFDVAENVGALVGG